MVRNLPASAGDSGSIPGSGRSAEVGNGNPLQSCLENPMDRGAWQATVLGGYKELVMTEHAHTESRPTKMHVSSVSLLLLWQHIINPRDLKQHKSTS